MSHCEVKLLKVWKENCVFISKDWRVNKLQVMKRSRTKQEMSRSCKTETKASCSDGLVFPFLTECVKRLKKKLKWSAFLSQHSVQKGAKSKPLFWETCKKSLKVLITMTAHSKKKRFNPRVAPQQPPAGCNTHSSPFVKAESKHLNGGESKTGH